MIFYYFNDFFVILTFDINIKLYDKQFDKLYKNLSFNINHTKNVIDIIIEFLRIELNNILMQTRFLSNKLIKMRNIV